MPMDQLPPKAPPTAASAEDVREALVPVQMRVRGNQIVGLVDHMGNELGMPLTALNADASKAGKVLVPGFEVASRRAVSALAAEPERQWMHRAVALSQFTFQASPTWYAPSVAKMDGGALYIQTQTGNQTELYANFPARLLPDRGVLDLDSNAWGAADTILMSITDPAGANGWRWRWYRGSRPEFYGTGKRSFSFGPRDYYQTIGTPDLASTLVSKITLMVAPINLTTKADIKYYGIELNPTVPSSRAAFVVGADDGLASWYTLGLPILEKYGLRAYIAVIYDKIGQPGYMTMAQMKDAVARGHQCVVHWCRGSAPNLRSFTTYDDLYAEISYHQNGLVSSDLARDGSQYIYIYPQSIYDLTTGDDTILRVLHDLKMVAARTTFTPVYPKQFELRRNRLDGKSAFAIPIIGHTWSATDETTNNANIVQSIHTCGLERRDAWLMYHNVTASPVNGQDITPTNLEAHCAAIAEEMAYGRADNLTPTEYLMPYVQDAIPLHLA